jgi:ABC-type Fe3+/spermidine/putrescine transport system ATPase subunit
VVMREGKIEQAGSVHELQRAPASTYVRALFDRAHAAHASLVAGES